jgi:hypothetical protein
MPDRSKQKIQSQDQPWYRIADLIAGIDATPTQKNLLTRIQRHTHARKGFAWMSQEELAREMRVSVSTVERGFAWGKKLGVITVVPQRTGNNPADQFNHYWLNIERLKELQSPPEHPASMLDEHPAQVTGEHPASSDANTLHPEHEHPSSSVRTPRTHAGIGFEVKQVKRTSGIYKAGAEKATSTATPGYIKPPHYPPTPKPENLPSKPVNNELLAALSANPAGHNGKELVSICYGISESDPRFGKASMRITGTVQRLRKAGYPITTTGTSHLDRRYVLRMH